MGAGRFKRTALQLGAVVGAVVLVGFILWLDFRTTLWQEMVILSGLAAGLVSFLLTTVVIDRVIRHQTETRWAPVTQLALTEMLHQLADGERSELTRGHVVPRELSLAETADPEKLIVELERLRHQIFDERSQVAATLGVWVQFLASSGDNEGLMRRIAELALQFDEVRDHALEAEGLAAAGSNTRQALADLRREISECNTHLAALITEIEGRLHPTRKRLSRSSGQRAEHPVIRGDR